MDNKVYVYTLNSRVIWWDKNLQQIPVIAEMYMVHRAEKPQSTDVSDCVNYVIKNYHKFDDEMIPAPLSDEENQRIMLVHLKVKFYMKLTDLINCSYRSAFPAVFSEEPDRIEMLARSTVKSEQLDEKAMALHSQFINTLITDKKNELKNRYISFVHQLKEATTIDAAQKVGYTIVYEGINIV